MTTFSQLEMISSQKIPNPPSEVNNYTPMDDTSVALRMQRELNGKYDPNLAFDAASVAEFGFDIP